MGTVTAVFARALAQAAGLRLTEEGNLFDGDVLVSKLGHTKGNISGTDYFELVDWIRANSTDLGGLPIAYARAVDIDNLGTLGLAIKTAPRLRDSLKRIERYFRLLTDTVSYHLDEAPDLALFILQRQTRDHPALHLRNECALFGFGRIFKELVGSELAYERVTFRHKPIDDIGRYEKFFKCTVHFGADRNAIVMQSKNLDLPMRLGDTAVSSFLTQHLDTELSAHESDDSFQRELAEHLSEALSNGIPKAATVALALGLSERTLFRRLSETGLTYQEVLERTQNSLAEDLLSQSTISITDVAFLTGFSDQSSFSRAFKRWVGQSPGAYRRSAV